MISPTRKAQALNTWHPLPSDAEESVLPLSRSLRSALDARGLWWGEALLGAAVVLWFRATGELPGCVTVRPGSADTGGRRLTGLADDAGERTFGEICAAVAATAEVPEDRQLVAEIGQAGRGGRRLALAAMREDDGTAVRIAVSSGLTTLTPTRTVELIGRILATLGDEPDLPVAELPPADSAERHREAAEHQGETVTLPYDSLVEAFAAVVAARPEAAAVHDDAGTTYSYRELDRESTWIAGLVRAAAVPAGEPVALAVEHGFTAVAAILGVLKAGHAYVPLDRRSPQQRLRTTLDQAGANTVLVDAATEAEAADLGGRRTLRLPDRRPDGEWDTPLPHRSGPDDTAYVMSTSGSLGVPKAVAVTHRNVLRLAYAGILPETALSGVFLHAAPLAFDASTFEIWTPLLNGGSLVALAPEKLDANSVAEAVARRGVTVAWLTAGVFHHVVGDHAAGLRGLRHLLAGGDVISPESVRQVLEAVPGLTVINGYGPTENTTFSCVHPMASAAEVGSGSVPIGRPIANSASYVLSPAGRPVPQGLVGELWVSGLGVADGYRGRPDLTEERFRPDTLMPARGRMYRTGDRAVRLPDGNLGFLGRVDDQVKIRGFRVEPGEIEARLRGLPGVADAAVVVRKEEGSGAAWLTAFVTAAPSVTLDPEEVRDGARRDLPDYMLPDHVYVLDLLPVTANGKLDRAALRDWTPPAPAEPTAPAAPKPAFRDDVERRIAELVGEILETEAPDPSADLLDHSLHSLRAMRLLGRVRREFGVRLSIAEAYEDPTVAGIATRIRRAMGVPEPAEAVSSSAEPGPVSFQQERIWTAQQLDPGSDAYQVPVRYRLRGPLDPDRLAVALRQLVQRHPVLRTSFVGHDSGVSQLVGDGEDFALNRVDLPASGIDQAVRAESSRCFEPTAPFPLRATLYRHEAEDHTLLLVFNHIAVDAPSMGVLLEELTAGYTTGAADAAAQPDAFAIDYARRQREWVESGDGEEQLSFWRDHLDGVTADDTLRQTATGGLPTAQTTSSHPVALPADLGDRIAAAARRLRSTPFALLLTSFAVVLKRFSATQDVLVAIPCSGRTDEQLERAVGYFANTLPFRCPEISGLRLTEYAACVRDTLFDCFAHQELPVEHVLRRLREEGVVQGNPRLSVMLSLNDVHAGRITFPGVDTELVPVLNQRPKFDLLLAMEQDGSRFSARLDFASGLLDPDTAEQLAAAFVRVLVELLDGGDDLADSVDLLAPGHRDAALRALHATKPAAQAPPVHHTILKRAAETPQAQAIVRPDGSTLTYAQLVTRATAVAEELRSVGAENGTVALCLPRSPEFVVAVLGVLLAGAAYLPVDMTQPERRRLFVLAEAGATAAVLGGEPGWEPPLPSVRVPEADLPAEPAGYEPAPCDPTAVAYVLSTSGSTGVPKAAAIPHRALGNLISWMAAEFGIGADDTVYFKTTPTFDASVWEYLLPLAVGGRVLVAAPEAHRDPAAMVADLTGNRVTVAQFVPTMLRALLAEPGFCRGGRLRYVFSGGEELHRATAEATRLATGAEVVNLYGPTEACVNTLFHRYDPADPEPKVPIGARIANATAYVLDTARNLLPDGFAGELYLGGVPLALGYRNRPELTAAAFVPHTFADGHSTRLYRTGDIVVRRGDGALVFLGRSDGQVKLRGQRVELGELKYQLLNLPGVVDAHVVVRSDADGGRLLAYYVAPQDRTEQVLREELAVTLPAALLPDRLVRMDALPVTASGKIDPAALPVPAPRPRGRGAAPRAGVETDVARLWSEALGIPVETVTRDVTLFDLGGTSLTVIRIRQLLLARMGADVAITDLFKYPTLAGTSRLVEPGAR